MSSDSFTTATQLSVLQAGRTPVWQQQDADEALLPPDAADSGGYLEGAVRALVHVSLREQAHRRTARLTIPVYDATCVYTVTINGIAVAYDATVAGDVTVEETLAGIADEINGDPDASLVVVATASGTPTLDTVVLRGIEEADYSLDFTESSGATLAVVADLTGAEGRLWWFMGARAGSTPPQAWATTDELVQVDRRGWVQRLDVAGLDRLHVQLAERVGHPGDGAVVTYADPVIAVGRCLSEVET